MPDVLVLPEVPVLPDVLVLPEVPEEPLLVSVLLVSVEVEVSAPLDEELDDLPELPAALCVGFVVVVARCVDTVGVVPEDVVVVFEVTLEAPVAVCLCFLWWRRVVVLVSVSELGALAAVVAVTSTGACAAESGGEAADDAAATSRATAIAPVPRAAPTPVTAVTRRTRRRTRSRCAAAIALAVALRAPVSPAFMCPP